jgi:hypothetical protein
MSVLGSYLAELCPSRSKVRDTYVDQLLGVSESELAADLVHDLLLLGLLLCRKRPSLVFRSEGSSPSKIMAIDD